MRGWAKMYLILIYLIGWMCTISFAIYKHMSSWQQKNISFLRLIEIFSLLKPTIKESNSYLHVPNVDCIENVEISTSESENKNTHHVVSKYYIGSSDIHRPVQTRPNPCRFYSIKFIDYFC